MNSSDPHYLQRRPASPNLHLDDFHLLTAERKLCTAALHTAGSIVAAAELLGITRHALKRRIIKLQIEWPPLTTYRGPFAVTPPPSAPPADPS